MKRSSFFSVTSFFSWKKNSKASSGFTLVEILVGATLFAIISMAVYQSYATLSSLVYASRVKITAADLLNERLELVRNMPYSQVGIVGGIPSGVIERVETFVRDNATFIATTTVRNVDDPFDGVIGGSPNDLSPADYKSVDIDLLCTTCKNFPEMSVFARISPNGLETASTNGALFVRVFDANGEPIPNASVLVENNSTSPAISIQEVTNNEGMLQIVDAPPGANVYEITVTKSGYTTDSTYPLGDPLNPNPTKPHATVAIQQVTQISFVIDRVGSIELSAVTSACIPVSGVTFNMKGSKMIGAIPDVYKYDVDHSVNGAGEKLINNLEWDTYSLTLTTAGYYLAGVNPLLPVALLPDAVQNVQLVVSDESPRILLVTVKDSATGLPVSGAEVTIERSGNSQTLLTGRGFINQTDWSGGSGQETVGDETAFYSSDGNIDVSNPMGEIRLQNILGVYPPAGILTSSTFDTGTTSNFNQISWSPISQNPLIGNPSVRFQIATNNDESTWNFTGPDGTENSFYDVSDANVHGSLNDNRYFRYKAFLDTGDDTISPNISDIALTFTSSCIPPGQAMFSDLPSGTYNITVEHSSYSTYADSVSVSSNWQQYEVTLLP